MILKVYLLKIIVQINKNMQYLFPFSAPQLIVGGGQNKLNISGSSITNENNEDVFVKKSELIDLLIPTGTILLFAGNSAPDGFLLCDGRALSRTEYAKLFSVVNTDYGEGDGSTTFNIPNYCNGNAYFVNNENVPVKGNGSPIGLQFNGSGDTYNASSYYGLDGLQANLPVIAYSQNYSSQTIGVTTDATKSGIQGTIATSQPCNFIIKF